MFDEPDVPETFEEAWTQARVLVRGQRLVDSIALFDRAIELRPDVGMVHFVRAMALATLKIDDEALKGFDRALALGVPPVDVQRSRARALQALGRHGEALLALDAAIAAAPDNADLHSELGLLLKTWPVARHQDALASLETAIALEPGNVMFQFNRALVLYDLQRPREAIEGFRRALELDPAHPRVNVALGHALIQVGEFEEGWQRYEWRDKTFIGDALPAWEGEPLEGRTLLVRHEQGIGDVLQYLRYVPLVAQLGKVVLEVRPEVLELARQVPGPAQLVKLGEPLPHADLQCAQMSLPLLLGLGGAIPSAQGYLRADAAKVAQWQRRLGQRRGLRVGVAWSGNPLHGNDAIRSIPLAQFRSGFVGEEVEYVALQNHVRASDREVFEGLPGMRYFADDLHDLDDAAALCEAMDLVISVDTSIAHLAGALGKPLWLLLPASPDWRWMLDRIDTPWYASARLFRQQRWFDWAPVMEQVRLEQRRFLGR